MQFPFSAVTCLILAVRVMLASERQTGRIGLLSSGGDCVELVVSSLNICSIHQWSHLGLKFTLWEDLNYWFGFSNKYNAVHVMFLLEGALVVCVFQIICPSERTVQFSDIKLFVMCLIAQWCPSLCEPMDCSPPGLGSIPLLFFLLLLLLLLVLLFHSV